jgi:hypothetical protein
MIYTIKLRYTQNERAWAPVTGTGRLITINLFIEIPNNSTLDARCLNDDSLSRMQRRLLVCRALDKNKKMRS